MDRLHKELSRNFEPGLLQLNLTFLSQKLNRFAKIFLQAVLPASAHRRIALRRPKLLTNQTVALSHRKMTSKDTIDIPLLPIDCNICRERYEHFSNAPLKDVGILDFQPQTCACITDVKN